jgi:pyruvate-formate lyase-activating enzyme
VVTIAPKLNVQEIIPKSRCPKLAYGTWNSLIALSAEGDFLGSVPAHDGDFFPESPEDYVTALRGTPDRRGQNVFPVRVDIDVTQVCNAHCTFCFSRPYQRMGFAGQWIATKDIQSIVDSCAASGTKTIRYCGGGDPMLHPEINTILKFPRHRDLNLTLITNGDFIDDGRLETINNYVDHLRWSVNAFSDETRTLVHRPSKSTRPLSQTKEQIRNLVALGKRKTQQMRPMIWATYLLMPENIHEAEKCAAEFATLGVDSLCFRPVFHGLHTVWTDESLSQLAVLLKLLPRYSHLPRYRVLVPKRHIASETQINPSDHFDFCISRRMRTVVEAFNGGAQFQSCGTYRGRQDVGFHFDLAHSDFGKNWIEFSTSALPRLAPSQCSECIDISMNKTLEFISFILGIDSRAEFFRARIA